MPRPPRIEFPGAWYHVYNRGIAKQDIFFDDQDRFLFLNLIGDMCDKLTVQCHGYCLMPNHYHLALHTPQGNLSEAVKRLISTFTRRANKRHDRDGPIFRGRFRSELVDSDEYLLSLSRYIHLNPVAAKIVDDPGKYKWSSYNTYTGGGQVPEWLETDFILRMMTGERPKQHYRNFVEGRAQPKVTWPPNQIAAIQDPTEPLSRRASAKLDEVLSVASDHFAATHDELLHSSRVHRAAVLLFLASSKDISVADLAKLFGYTDASSLSATLSRWRRELKTNSQMQDTITALTTQLKH